MTERFQLKDALQAGRHIWLASLGAIAIVGRGIGAIAETGNHSIQKIKNVSDFSYNDTLLIQLWEDDRINKMIEVFIGIIDTIYCLFIQSSGSLHTEIDWISEACIQIN